MLKIKRGKKKKKTEKERN